jgi:hypothetical protein
MFLIWTNEPISSFLARSNDIMIVFELMGNGYLSHIALQFEVRLKTRADSSYLRTLFIG